MKYLGIDYGLKRVGLAASDGELASPLNTLKIRKFKDAVEQITALAKDGGFEKIIVGMPQGKIGKTVLAFIKALRKNGQEVIEADETLSTHLALESMIKEGVPMKKRRMNDSHAAAIILQNYLDSL